MNGLFICICTWPRVEMFTTAGVTRLIMGARVGTAWPDTTGGSTWARAGREAKLEATSTAAKTMRFIGYVLLSLYMPGRWGFDRELLPATHEPGFQCTCMRQKSCRSPDSCDAPGWLRSCSAAGQ